MKFLSKNVILLLAQSITISYTCFFEIYSGKICIKKGIIMISEEYYLNFLKCIISCVNNGDYYSIKELSVLELEKMKKNYISDKSNSKILK